MNGVALAIMLPRCREIQRRLRATAGVPAAGKRSPSPFRRAANAGVDQHDPLEGPRGQLWMILHPRHISTAMRTKRRASTFTGCERAATALFSVTPSDWHLGRDDDYFQSAAVGRANRQWSSDLVLLLAGTTQLVPSDALPLRPTLSRLFLRDASQVFNGSAEIKNGCRLTTLMDDWTATPFVVTLSEADALPGHNEVAPRAAARQSMTRDGGRRRAGRAHARPLARRE